MMVLAVITSRVLLSTLGVENYGIYNVVGGVVAMFTSIRSVLASSVQRFLNFYKGKGESDKVATIFCTSFFVHIVLALIFALLLEVAGVWFIKNFLAIPNGFLHVALFVFHCSLLAVLLSILTIPYDAVVIANEHMNFYAYISIADAALKLLIIFLLPLLSFEYIKSYAILVLSITLVLRIITVIYCRQFSECKLKNIFDKSLFVDISSFAGWNFLGCTASSLIEEGSNFVLNSFGGVVANAARGIAYQVRSALYLISGNVIVASQPFIMQQAGIVDRNRFFYYIYLQTRILFYIISLTCLPLYVYCQEILSLWLTDVPFYTVQFTQAILIYIVVMSFQKSLDLAFKSYGIMAKYQLIDTIITLSTLPGAYLVLKLGYPLHYVFYIFSVVRIFDYIIILFLARYQINMPITDYFRFVVVRCLLAAFIAIIIGKIFFCYFVSTNVCTLIVYSILIIFITLLMYYVFVFSQDEKKIINKVLIKKREVK